MASDKCDFLQEYFEGKALGLEDWHQITAAIGLIQSIIYTIGSSIFKNEDIDNKAYSLSNSSSS